jgi:SusD family
MRLILTISLASLALLGCDLNVSNPDVINAAQFNPNTDGVTLSMSAQTNTYQAFQSVALYGGLISEELWTGAIRPETNHIAARAFVGTDDIAVDFFDILSVSLASNVNAVNVLVTGSAAASDSNYARVSMNAGLTFLLMAETMCSSDVLAGPELSDAQLLDSAVTHFQKAITVGTAASNSQIALTAQVGLARAYLQAGSYANAISTAATVPASFVDYEINSPNPATATTLGNLMVVTTDMNQLVVPARYRHLNDPRVPSDSTGCSTTSEIACVIQTKYTSFGDNIRMASGLEALFISAEAQLHQGTTAAALALIASERANNGQPAYSGGTDTLSVLTELLNQRAREFWMEAKKLGDIRRNPSVPLTGILTDPAGSPFYGPTGGVFGTTICVPIPPQETGSNPNLERHSIQRP